MDAVDLFAGPGGWDIAAEALGLDVLGIELDDAACATREAVGLPTLKADVSALVPNEIAVEGRGIIASPPCQAFSMAGNGHGRRALPVYEEAVKRSVEGKPPSRDELDEACEDEGGHLVLEPLRWTLALSPAWVALEQVEPVLPLWEAMARALTTLGYSTWAGLLSAERYGVPQTRRRAIMLARRDGVAREPAATHRRYIAPWRRGGQDETLFEAPEPVRIVAPGEDCLLPWVSMAEALGWGMTARPGMTLAFGTKSGGASLDGGGSGARAVLHAERENGRWLRAGEGRNIGGKNWTGERPATTVNGDPRISEPGHHDSDVSGSQQANAVRVSIKEATVLQSFPADYPWQGTRTKVFEQIGNAIPPLLAHAILEEITR